MKTYTHYKAIFVVITEYVFFRKLIIVLSRTRIVLYFPIITNHYKSANMIYVIMLLCCIHVCYNSKHVMHCMA